ncbi:hypothetical protein VO56_00720 [Mycoplasmopsis gallinacea]|uniref:Lipoprotein n=2 Tax=Mycoplasmopsis gallinacea TaxID=29556 RepID=A0A0D5ZJG1_9BACT|nr:hypothetical protein VO56_00720 [Mycoplasmopsis gallinacea]
MKKLKTLFLGSLALISPLSFISCNDKSKNEVDLYQEITKDASVVSLYETSFKQINDLLISSVDEVISNIKNNENIKERFKDKQEEFEIELARIQTELLNKEKMAEFYENGLTLLKEDLAKNNNKYQLSIILGKINNYTFSNGSYPTAILNFAYNYLNKDTAKKIDALVKKYDLRKLWLQVNNNFNYFKEEMDLFLDKFAQNETGEFTIAPKDLLNKTVASLNEFAVGFKTAVAIKDDAEQNQKMTELIRNTATKYQEIVKQFQDNFANIIYKNGEQYENRPFSLTSLHSTYEKMAEAGSENEDNAVVIKRIPFVTKEDVESLLSVFAKQNRSLDTDEKRQEWINGINEKLNQVLADNADKLDLENVDTLDDLVPFQAMSVTLKLSNNATQETPILIYKKNDQNEFDKHNLDNLDPESIVGKKLLSAQIAGKVKEKYLVKMDLDYLKFFSKNSTFNPSFIEFFKKLNADSIKDNNGRFILPQTPFAFVSYLDLKVVSLNVQDNNLNLEFKFFDHGNGRIIDTIGATFYESSKARLFDFSSTNQDANLPITNSTLYFELSEEQYDKLIGSKILEEKTFEDVQPAIDPQNPAQILPHPGIAPKAPEAPVQPNEHAYDNENISKEEKQAKYQAELEKYNQELEAYNQKKAEYDKLMEKYNADLAQYNELNAKYIEVQKQKEEYHKAQLAKFAEIVIDLSMN